MKKAVVVGGLVFATASCSGMKVLTHEHDKKESHWHEHEKKVHESKKGMRKEL